MIGGKCTLLWLAIDATEGGRAPSRTIACKQAPTYCSKLIRTDKSSLATTPDSLCFLSELLLNGLCPQSVASVKSVVKKELLINRRIPVAQHIHQRLQLGTGEAGPSPHAGAGTFVNERHIVRIE